MADANPITTPAGREGQNLPHVFIRGGDVFTNSRDVAALFEKEHRNVLQAIDTLIEQEPSLAEGRLLKFQQSFAEVETGNGTARQFRTFDMDRDGFSLLAMGFTGPKALKWKMAYIRAFNMMEARLNAPAADLLGEVSLREKKLALDMVREARIMYGPRAARRLWATVGLPEIEEDFPEAPAAQAGRDWRGALRHLCFAPVDHAATRIWAMARHAIGEEGGTPSTAAALWLMDRGMVIDGRRGGWLFISNSSPWADSHFAGTPWAGCWRAAMRQVAGAERMRFYLNRRQQRGVNLPLRLVASLAEEV